MDRLCRKYYGFLDLPCNVCVYDTGTARCEMYPDRKPTEILASREECRHFQKKQD
jgi:hypothetical protein